MKAGYFRFWAVALLMVVMTCVMCEGADGLSLYLDAASKEAVVKDSDIGQIIAELAKDDWGKGLSNRVSGAISKCILEIEGLSENNIQYAVAVRKLDILCGIEFLCTEKTENLFVVTKLVEEYPLCVKFLFDLELQGRKSGIRDMPHLAQYIIDVERLVQAGNIRKKVVMLGDVSTYFDFYVDGLLVLSRLDLTDEQARYLKAYPGIDGSRIDILALNKRSVPDSCRSIGCIPELQRTALFEAVPAKEQAMSWWDCHIKNRASW